MTQLLIQGSAILAQGPFVDDGENIRSYTPDGAADAVWPKHVIEGCQVVDAALPDGFTCAGYTWNGAQVVAKPPVVQPGPRIIAPLDFFALFTDAEQLAIAHAATQNAAILLWFNKASAAQFINLDNPELQTGLGDLLAAGLITQERHDRILIGLPPA